jgi:hypothetical protein
MDDKLVRFLQFGTPLDGDKFENGVWGKQILMLALD